jgi:MFS family permease
MVEPDTGEIRRSFKLLSMDAIFYYAGTALIDPTTVLPVFLATLTKSSIVIGLTVTIRLSLLLLPQMWSAHYLRNRKRHKAYLIKGASVSRIAVALFAVVLFVAGPHRHGLMLWSFMGMYCAFWLSEGLVQVSWTDLCAKCIPERLRGRLFGTMQFGGGILGALAGILVLRMLAPHAPRYPINYAILAAVAAVMFTTSLISLSAVHEPDGIPEAADDGFVRYVRDLGSLIRAHSQIRRLIAVQLLMGVFGMSSVFYILYAKLSGGITDAMVGYLLFAQTVGSMLLSAVAGYVSDHHGPKLAIVMNIVIGLSVPLLILIVPKAPIWIYCIAFFAMGGTLGSGWIGIFNFILELANPKERKSYIGLLNTANAPTLIFPIIGGYLVQKTSYPIVFTITAVALFIALILAIGLSYPRMSRIQR